MTEQAYQYDVLVNTNFHGSFTGPAAQDNAVDYMMQLLENGERDVSIIKRKWPTDE